MKNTKADLASKRIKRSSYVTHVKRKKTIQLWTNSLDLNDQMNPLSLLVSNLDQSIKIMDTETIYHNNFRNFYNIHIRPKYDDKEENEYDSEEVKRYKRQKGVYFCASDMNGGVDMGYIIQTAQRKDTGTLISMDIDETSGEILEVYALASFNVSSQKVAVHISTLCGNKVLPSSGEGTRLLKLIENTARKGDFNKVFLDPVIGIEDYYAENRYRILTEKDSKGTPKSTSSSSDSSDSSSSSSSSSREPLQMQKNMRAQKHWNKVRTAYNLGVLLSRSRKSMAKQELQDRYIKMRDEEISARPSLKGKSIAPVGSSFTSQRKGFVPNLEKKTRGIPSALVLPGESLRKRHRSMKRHKTMHKSRTRTRTKSRTKSRSHARTRSRARTRSHARTRTLK
jgi:hypothetical protein